MSKVRPTVSGREGSRRSLLVPPDERRGRACRNRQIRYLAAGYCVGWESEWSSRKGVKDEAILRQQHTTARSRVHESRAS
eukprot:101029-Pleurochrysis_carterae.AAC.1